MAEEKVSRKKAYAPTDGDYELSRIGIEEAENGVVIECSYHLKEDVRDKMSKDRDQGIYSPMDSYCEPERHVFEDKAEAKAFINSELDALWADNAEDEAAE